MNALLLLLSLSALELISAHHRHFRTRRIEPEIPVLLAEGEPWNNNKVKYRRANEAHKPYQDLIETKTLQERNMIKLSGLYGMTKTALNYTYSGMKGEFVIRGIVPYTYRYISGPRYHLTGDEIMEELLHSVTVQSRALEKEYYDPPNVVYPELLVVVHHETFKGLKSEVDYTVRFVKQYWKGVNEYLAKLSNPRIKPSIRGIVIAKNSAATPYINTALRSSDDWSQALSATAKYFGTQRQIAEYYDIVMVMVYTTKEVNQTQGLTYEKGICQSTFSPKGRKNLAVGIVNADAGPLVGAHEMGHLLGAPHDAYTGVGQCLTLFPETYVMYGGVELNTDLKSQRFSDCTAAHISVHLQSFHSKCVYIDPDAPVISDFGRSVAVNVDESVYDEIEKSKYSQYDDIYNWPQPENRRWSGY